MVWIVCFDWSWNDCGGIVWIICCWGCWIWICCKIGWFIICICWREFDWFCVFCILLDWSWLEFWVLDLVVVGVWDFLIVRLELLVDVFVYWFVFVEFINVLLFVRDVEVVVVYVVEEEGDFGIVLVEVVVVVGVEINWFSLEVLLFVVVVGWLICLVFFLVVILFIIGKVKVIFLMLIGRVVIIWVWVLGRVCNCSGIEILGLIWIGIVWFVRFWVRIFLEVVLLVVVSIVWLLFVEMSWIWFCKFWRDEVLVGLIWICWFFIVWSCGIIWYCILLFGFCICMIWNWSGVEELFDLVFVGDVFSLLLLEELDELDVGWETLFFFEVGGVEVISC